VLEIFRYAIPSKWPGPGGERLAASAKEQLSRIAPMADIPAGNGKVPAGVADFSWMFRARSRLQKLREDHDFANGGNRDHGAAI
jgi:hypothetical protein